MFLTETSKVLPYLLISLPLLIDTYFGYNLLIEPSAWLELRLMSFDYLEAAKVVLSVGLVLLGLVCQAFVMYARGIFSNLMSVSFEWPSIFTGVTSNPTSDLDLSSSTDSEDLFIFAADVFEFGCQDFLLLWDVCGASILGLGGLVGGSYGLSLLNKLVLSPLNLR